jgi:hypothetical protein
MDDSTLSKIALNVYQMKNEGKQPLDCLRYATDEGRLEYPDAVWLVTRVLKLDDDAVFEMEESY